MNKKVVNSVNDLDFSPVPEPFSVKNVTSSEYVDALQIVGETIESLDDIAIKELMAGSSSDIDLAVETMMMEAMRIIHIPGRSEFRHKLGGLDMVSDMFEETMKRALFPYFILTMLPRLEFAPHIIEWSTLVHVYRLLCIIAARGHSKSHTYSFAYPLWKMYRYSPKRGENTLEYRLSKEGMIITNEYSLAKKFLGEVRDEIENNDLLREKLYPKSRQGWGAESLHAANGSILHAKSAGSKMRGYHPSYFVLDDYLNESVLFSADQNSKYIRFFDAVISNMLLKNGQCIVVGTPFVENDLYGHLKGIPEWEVLEYPALMPDGTILWESEHTAESLSALRKRIGTVNFSREILVKPISDLSAVIPFGIVSACFDDSFTLVDTREQHPLAKDIVSVVTGIDYAFSSSASADFVRIYTIGILSSGKCILMNVKGGRGIRYGTQIEFVKDVNRRFQTSLNVSESNQGQVVMSDMLIDEGLPVMKHTTGIDKHSLYEGIPAISILFENKGIILPTGDADSRSVSERLGRQLSSFVYNKDKGRLSFTLEHDDDALAFWQCMRGINYITKRTFSYI